MTLSAEKLKKILTDSFGIEAHEKVLITGPAKWVYAIAVECEKVGASPILCSVSPQSSRAKALQRRFRSVAGDHLLSVTEEIDTWIEICLPFPRRWRTKQASDKPEATLVMPDWVARIIQKNVRQCSLMVPAGRTQVREAVTKALEADAENMAKLGKSLKEKLDPARNVYITTRLGTDLKIALSGTGVDVDCGIRDPDLQIENIVYMPSGVITLRPQETSADGLVVVPKTYLRRAHTGWIKNLQLQFERGRVRAFRSESRLSVFKKIMEEATGDKDVIAEFGLGLNPNVRNLIGSMRLDELMSGSVRIAIGDNHWWMGGKNKSDLHWDFLLPEATVELDGKTILERGKFRVN